MIFLRAKNDSLFCQWCSCQILEDEHYMVTFSKKRKSSFYHVECYKEYYNKLVDDKYNEWFEKLEPQSHAGRPKKYRNGKRINQLKSLLKHHTIKGNESRIEEITKELRKEGYIVKSS